MLVLSIFLLTHDMGRNKKSRYHKKSDDYQKKNDDIITVDFEKADLGASGFLDVLETYEEKGFVFAPELTGEAPAAGFIANADSTLRLFGSTFKALESLADLGNGAKPNQALTPAYLQPFPDDLIITYFENDDDWGDIAEQEDFKFKGCYVAGLEASAKAVTEFEVTFTGLYEGKVVGEFTTLATSGGFVKSQIKEDIDTLIIGTTDPNIGFFVDNMIFDV